MKSQALCALLPDTGQAHQFLHQPRQKPSLIDCHTSAMRDL
jgi:hypothetical protein